MPAGMGLIMGLEPSPDGQAVAIVGFGDLRTDESVVDIMSLADGSSRRIATFPSEFIEPPRWLSDGHLLLPVGETRWTLSLYRLPVAGGPMVRLGPVPRFPGSYRFAADGRRGIIRAVETNLDVFVVPNLAALAGE
jgi:hypothetical protein